MKTPRKFKGGISSGGHLAGTYGGHPMHNHAVYQMVTILCGCSSRQMILQNPKVQ